MSLVFGYEGRYNNNTEDEVSFVNASHFQGFIYGFLIQSILALSDFSKVYSSVPVLEEIVSKPAIQTISLVSV